MLVLCAVILNALLLQGVKAKGESALAKTCPPPDVPENAKLVRKVTNFTIGSTVKMVCDTGFFRRGRRSRMKCLPNRQWTKSDFSCVARSCGDPGSPTTGGERHGWSFQFRDTVNFTCFAGYVLVGPKTRTCLATGWSEVQPSCSPIQCKEPPKVVGASVMESTNGFLYEAQVHYMCRQGYQMQGSATLTCGPNGEWIGETPNCKVIVCEDPGIPLHGSRNGSKVFNYKAKLSFQCNKGFILYGAHERTCSEDGKWTGPQPYCVECAGVGTPVFIRKGYFFTRGLVKAKRGNVVTVSTAPKDKEKNVVILGRGTQHYAIVEDKVPSPKYVFIGTRVLAMHVDNERYAFAVVTRIKDGKYWVRFEHDNQRRKFTIDFIRILYPPTFCATCPAPEEPYSGIRLISSGEFIPGSEVMYVCETNTELVGSDKRKCLPSGLWTGQQPTCQAIGCRDIDVLPPENGKRVGNDFSVGSTVTYSCNQGYELIGDIVLTCQTDRQWSRMVPICKDLCDRQQCEPWKKCVYNISSESTTCECRKSTDCLGRFQQICGSDAKTYNNDCIMKATACREGRTIEKVANGSCTPASICQIVPKSVCRGFFRNYYYNTTSRKCEEIIAGGCHPSGWNGFSTKQECNRTCSVNICDQPVDPGPCFANVSHWAFNRKAGRCKLFKYGGCFGNENNFDSEKKCNQRCPPTAPAKRKKVCGKCPSKKIIEVCKESTFGLIGKMEQELPNDPTMKRARYRIIIDEVLKLKNSTGSLSARSAVISVQNVKALTCPCTSFPKFKFVLLGKVVLDSSESATELNIIVKRPAVVRKWNKEFVKKLRKSCAKYFTDLETAE
ncbi:C4b-binding protein alpha chain-like isoform X1 [Acropora muricata]|uniref:C4b-binding protein alpha chain-like isoform X1 n=1 Tax=Acropora muricata TaxID=159855 RepID=UPI0034E407CA